jgi:beta-galactosidase GanA
MRIHHLTLGLCLLATTAFAQPNTVRKLPEGYIGDNKFYYGASYYPEAWDLEANPNQIDQDIVRMKELNMNVMRMAEFSWSTMEPTEGAYSFQWLHKIIDKLKAAGIDVILGTPTATPPAWLIQKYPSMMLTKANGKQEVHGLRRDCSYASADYQRECVRITEKMAAEFGRKPGVIAWQTDNEMSVTYDFGPETKTQWHAWLQKKYGTIERLNKLWSLALWSQAYQDFNQIPMPDIEKWHNPSLEMAWVRFWNDEIIHFQDLQLAAIRKYSNAPITHDGMPGQSVDYPGLFKDLDFMAVNNYHSFEAYDLIMSNYDRMRGYGKGYHWLFETAPNFSGGGNNGQTWFLHSPEGSMRAALWMNHALGAQGSMFWLWRQQPAGQEMTHGAVLSAWGKPSANYNDLKALGAELQKVGKDLMYMPVDKAKVAVMWDHKAKVGLEIEEYTNGIKYYNDWTNRFYLPVANTYLHRDVISPNTDLTPYKVLFIPLMPNLDATLKAKLKAWVTTGGTLILGPMTGYRNDEWAANTSAALGDLEQWTGITGETMIPIGTKPRPAEPVPGLRFAETLNLTEAPAQLWAMTLSSKTGSILATYSSCMVKDQPAIIQNNVGKGQVIVMGTDPGKEAVKAIVLKAAKEAGISPVIKGEAGIVAVPRNGKIGKAIALVNITGESKSITLPYPGTDLLTGQKTGTALTLKPFEVQIVKE